MPGYGTPLSLTLPTINGVAKESAAAPLINTALSAIIARLESKIGAADLDINADVSFKSGAVYSGAKDLHRAAFQSQTGAITAASNPNTVYVLNGDLHYIDASGNLVQITASGAVNVSTTGGITGSGYGTGGVEVNWDSGNSKFSLKSGAGANDFADVECADVLLRDGSNNTIRFQAPAIASDYTLSLLSALPASTQLLQVSSAGLMSASNTVSQAVTLSAALTAAAGTFSGLVTANAGVTAGANQHVTVSGTGRFKHGAVNRAHPAALMTNGDDSDITLGYIEQSSAGVSIVCPIIKHNGERLLSVLVTADKAGGAGDRDLSLCHANSTTGAKVVDQTGTSTTTGMGTVTYNFTDTALTESDYWLEYQGEAGDRVYAMTVELDLP